MIAKREHVGKLTKNMKSFGVVVIVLGILMTTLTGFNIITKKNRKDDFSVSAKATEETAGSEYHPFSYKGVHTQNINLNYKKSN